MDNCTILINACDKYVDTWEPTLRLFEIQWPDCPCDFVINSETKVYDGVFKNVRTVCFDKQGTWTERFENVLKQIETPYVLFTIEDYFLLNKVNSKVFDEAISIMDNNPNVGMVCLSHTDRKNIKTDEYEDENFYSRKINPECMIWCRICLYRRDYLLQLLRSHETIWEFEKYASYRARKLPYIILQQNKNEAEVFTFKVKIEEGYGITKGKWLPKNVEFFAEKGISVNFETLGIYDPAAPLEVEKNKIVPQKKNIRERLYSVKHFIKEVKKKIQKNWREYKSKH